MHSTPETEGLGDLREKIDGIDRAILDLIVDRAAVALRIAEVKRKTGKPVYDPERERTLLTALSEIRKGALPDGAVQRIFGEIISACRAVQEPTRVAYLGPEDTFSHMAAVEVFGRSAAFLPRGNIGDVFREVEHGRAEMGVVPAENSNNGQVGSTLDEWVDSDLQIRGEYFLAVTQSLLTRETELAKIERVYSHPQALAQCRLWLARNLPNAALIETSSTGAAAARAAEEPGSAAIGNELPAERLGLNILASAIQDKTLNLTRFLVIGREDHPPTGRDKTSFLFGVTHKPGALHDSLAPMAEAGLNMTRIESRPTRDRPWEYVFFIDIEGHRTQTRIRETLEKIADRTDRFKLLGSYPAADVGGQERSME